MSSAGTRIQQAGVFIRAEAERQLDQNLPDRWVFGEGDIEEQLGEDKFAAMAYVRERLAQGFVYTSDNLREAMARKDFTGTDLQWDSMSMAAKQNFIENSGSVERISDVRGWVKDGIVLDQENLRGRIGDDNPDGLENFDNFRNAMGKSRSLLWLGWLLMIGLLAGIGLLGGRSWLGRLAWPAAFLAVASVALFIVAGPVYNGVVESRLEEQLADSLEDAEGFDAVMTEKMGEISITAAGDAISGVRSRGLLFLGLSAVMAAAGVVAVRTMELGKSMGKSEAAKRARA